MNSEGVLRMLDETEEAPDGYEVVPAALRTAAQLELMGKKETRVGLRASGSMSKFARSLRRKKALAL